MALQTIRSLMSGMIDYAGLFPPARLPMAETVEHYARALMGEHAWMLGRLICPASRLDELSAAGAALMPGTYARSGYTEQQVMEPWLISVISDEPIERVVEWAGAFNAHHSEVDSGLARIDAVELRPRGPGAIETALDAIPDEIYAFAEVPPEGDSRGFVAALAGTEAGAKIRCGGVTPDAFPTCERVAAFIHACAAADVPFKATAGLHHATRGPHALTYEPGSAEAVMHGFLNLFIAASLVRTGKIGAQETTVDVLESASPEDFVIEDDRIAWRTHELTAAEIASVRGAFAMGFGSCSFDEPVRELAALGVL